MVLSGDLETRYRRAGAGASVLLLCATPDAPAGRRLFDTLASRFRVIAPWPGEDGGPDGLAGDSTAWLRGVIDGLGLHHPAIVADDGFALRALAFAVGHPGRIGRVVLLVRDTVGRGSAEDRVSGGGTPTLVEVLEGSGRPFLLLRVGGDGDGGVDLAQEHLEQISRFLVGEEEY